MICLMSNVKVQSSNETEMSNFKKPIFKLNHLALIWPERAPQAPPCLSAGRQVGEVKGHNMKRDYLTGKPRPVAGELHI